MPVTIPIRQVKDDEETRLLREGWEKKTTLGEPRLSEVAESYRALGYEVLVQGYQSGGPGCNTCFDAGQEMGITYGTVYVRRREGATDDDELF